MEGVELTAEDACRKHIRSPSECGRVCRVCLMEEVLERHMSSELVDKKTVIVMIGLPVKVLLFHEGLGDGKELYFQNVASLSQLERI